MNRADAPVGEPDQRVDLPRPIPVYMTYFTAVPAAGGRWSSAAELADRGVQFRPGNLARVNLGDRAFGIDKQSRRKRLGIERTGEASRRIHQDPAGVDPLVMQIVLNVLEPLALVEE
jgi:hypothetical protein